MRLGQSTKHSEGAKGFIQSYEFCPKSSCVVTTPGGQCKNLSVFNGRCACVFC